MYTREMLLADPELLAETAGRLKALVDPSRLKIVMLLQANPKGLTVIDLMPHLGLLQPTVSHHVKILAEAGLVKKEKEGVFVFCTLRQDAVRSMMLQLGEITGVRVR